MNDRKRSNQNMIGIPLTIRCLKFTHPFKVVMICCHWCTTALMIFLTLKFFIMLIGTSTHHNSILNHITQFGNEAYSESNLIRGKMFQKGLIELEYSFGIHLCFSTCGRIALQTVLILPDLCNKKCCCWGKIGVSPIGVAALR